MARGCKHLQSYARAYNGNISPRHQVYPDQPTPSLRVVYYRLPLSCHCPFIQRNPFLPFKRVPYSQLYFRERMPQSSAAAFRLDVNYAHQTKHAPCFPLQSLGMRASTSILILSASHTLRSSRLRREDMNVDRALTSETR